MWKQLFSSSAAFYSSKHETFCIKQGLETSENKETFFKNKNRLSNDYEKAAQSLRFLKLSPFELN